MWEGIGFAVATIAGKEARRKEQEAIRRALNHGAPANKSRCNRTGYPHDKESRREAQFKFFGYKPKRFISNYAKKPRILVKVKEELKFKVNLNRSESALYEAEMQYRRNMDSYNQMTAIRQPFMGLGNLAMGQASHGLGGLVGLSDGLGNARYQAQFLGAGQASAAGGLGGGNISTRLY